MMARRRLSLFAPLLLAAASPEMLMIGGERFTQSDIIDARTIADGTGQPVILISFSPEATARLAVLARGGTPLRVLLGTMPIGDPVTPDGDTVQLRQSMTFAAAAALARQISGRDPLPESEGE
jgi:hypothetical protein